MTYNTPAAAQKKNVPLRIYLACMLLTLLFAGGKYLLNHAQSPYEYVCGWYDEVPATATTPTRLIEEISVTDELTLVFYETKPGIYASRLVQRTAYRTGILHHTVNDFLNTVFEDHYSALDPHLYDTYPIKELDATLWLVVTAKGPKQVFLSQRELTTIPLDDQGRVAFYGLLSDTEQQTLYASVEAGEYPFTFIY